jgi:hypothetical protein
VQDGKICLRARGQKFTEPRKRSGSIKESGVEIKGARVDIANPRVDIAYLCEEILLPLEFKAAMMKQMKGPED